MALPNAGPTNCSSGLSLRLFNNLAYDNPWKASQGGYVAGVKGCPLTLNGYGYSVSTVTTGTTGSSEPTWPTIIGNTVVDGGVTWHCDVACNPSGNGQNYQGILSAAGIAAFQLLAYDTARAICDEVQADALKICYDIGTTTPSMTGGTNTIVNFLNKQYDSNNAVTVGASWKFTVPTGFGGIFHVSAAADIGSMGATAEAFISIYQNGNEVRRANRATYASATNVGLSVSSDILCADGDFLDIRVYVGTTSSLEIATTPPSQKSYITIHRITGT